jgi:hypothetical protein
MLRHVVLYNPRRGANCHDLEHNLDQLRKMKEQIKGIESLCWVKLKGQNSQAQKFSYAIFVDFLSEQAFEEYRAFPAHLKIKEQMKPLLDEKDPLLIFDFDL